MKKIIVTIFLFLIATISFAQNVGIGTTAPEYTLHVKTSVPLEASIGVNAAGTASQAMVNLSIDNRVDGNALLLLKYRPGASGFASGLPKSNLSFVGADFGAADLLVGTNANFPLHFGTNSFERMRITEAGNVGIGNSNTFSGYARLHVNRFVNAGYGPAFPLGAIYAENGSTIDGSGLYGITFSPRTGISNYAAVSGVNFSPFSDRFGVIGSSNGTTTGSLYSAGVGGYGYYGVSGSSDSITGAGVFAQHGSGKTALEVNNGFIKVSGTNKTAFKHTTAAGNVAGDFTSLTYDSQSANDILIVTHNFSPTGTYLNKAFGVYWTGSYWAIYLEDQTAMPLNLTFNVLVIKQ